MTKKKLNDEAEAEHFADQANREAAGPSHRLPAGARRLSRHIPVRFSPEVVAQVQRLADEDDTTVSTWIRRVVEREVDKRLRRGPRTEAPLGAELIRLIQSTSEEWPTKGSQQVRNEDPNLVVA